VLYCELLGGRICNMRQYATPTDSISRKMFMFFGLTICNMFIGNINNFVCLIHCCLLLFMHMYLDYVLMYVVFTA